MPSRNTRTRSLLTVTQELDPVLTLPRISAHREHSVPCRSQQQEDRVTTHSPKHHDAQRQLSRPLSPPDHYKFTNIAAPPNIAPMAITAVCAGAAFTVTMLRVVLEVMVGLVVPERKVVVVGLLVVWGKLVTTVCDVSLLVVCVNTGVPDVVTVVGTGCPGTVTVLGGGAGCGWPGTVTVVGGGGGCGWPGTVTVLGGGAGCGWPGTVTVVGTGTVFGGWPGCVTVTVTVQ